MANRSFKSIQVQEASLQSTQPLMLGRQRTICEIPSSPLSKPPVQNISRPTGRPRNGNETEFPSAQSTTEIAPKVNITKQRARPPRLERNPREFSDVTEEKENSESTVPSFTPRSDTNVPSWIPLEERRYWMAECPVVEPLSTKSVGSTTNADHLPPIHPDLNVDPQNGNLTPVSARKFNIWNWRMFRFLKTKRERQHANMESPSARRSFRKNGNGFSKFLGSRRELEDRMSVDRDAYNRQAS